MMTTKTKNILKVIGILCVGILLGSLIFGGSDTPKSEHDHKAEQVIKTIWTCSMHPQIRMDKPGKCPLCGMELIPLESNDSAANTNAVQMTANALKLANIQTMIVGSKQANKELRLNGKIQIDERNLYTQSSHIPGRIETLKINFTGEKVYRGQTLAMVYSPQLVTAQEELLQAYSMKTTQPELFEAAKQKLNNWKIGENTINKIINNGKPIQQFPITADVSGIITAKKVELGDYVDRGMPIYEIADLSKLWVLFDVYESDMPWVNVGDEVIYTVKSLPGKTFKGVISFIDPLINAQTRVASARVEVKNSDDKLKPEMFVSGVIKNDISKTASKDIVVPKSAVMWTGERSIVYIKSNGNNNVNFRLRNVTLGPSLGDAYIIENGLKDGDEIVVKGSFTVDAASQLAGKPSMMNPESSNELTSNMTMIDKSKIDMKFKQQLGDIVAAYIKLKNALVDDNSSLAQQEAKKLTYNLENTDMSLLHGDAHTIWMKFLKTLQEAANKTQNSKDIGVQRDAFLVLGKKLSEAITTLGVETEKKQPLYLEFCPMAHNNEGGYWLSYDKEIKNPYFGKAMLTCGEVKAIYY
ncbi:efflux RND transporter periplasmic adaptor subunit [Yeosuana marina]|uniref:efflux RND transporter periplasmic adaptor subunit n=1 Tax=Yeosuana marina TaxID=1565536 RepID=UPI0030ECC4C5|tara:strand:- start:12441 stop:14189 length:1749 start_codon:yes stop_codon:yes gene_type:complete